jgi:hypothetical protein
MLTAYWLGLLIDLEDGGVCTSATSAPTELPETSTQKTTAFLLGRASEEYCFAVWGQTTDNRQQTAIQGVICQKTLFQRGNNYLDLRGEM